MRRFLLLLCCVVMVPTGLWGIGKARVDRENRLILAKTSDFQERLFFKPKLVRKKNWTSVYNEFKRRYYLEVSVLSGGRNNSTLVVELAAKPGSGATFETAEGGILALVPKETMPNVKNVQVGFYKGSKEVIGASFPGFKTLVKTVLSNVAPGKISNAVELVFARAGVGRYDHRFEGTLFEVSEYHRAADVTWDAIYHEGRRVKPTRIKMRIPLLASADKVKRAVQKRGIGVMIAVKTSVSGLRVFFIVDRLRTLPQAGVLVLHDAKRTGQLFDFSLGRIVTGDFSTTESRMAFAIGEREGDFYVRPSARMIVPTRVMGIAISASQEDESNERVAAELATWESEYSERLRTAAIKNKYLVNDQEELRTGRKYWVNPKDGKGIGMVRVLDTGADSVRFEWRFFPNAGERGVKQSGVAFLEWLRK